jgi:predicted RNA binding protein YcfA (HicA-like mRNA interferase family)
MKLPRGVSGARLVRALEHLGYTAVRQKGSHVRLRHQGAPPHSITIPLHNPLKTGTLHSIVADIARTRSIAVESIIDLLCRER